MLTMLNFLTLSFYIYHFSVFRLPIFRFFNAIFFGSSTLSPAFILVDEPIGAAVVGVDGPIVLQLGVDLVGELLT